MAFLVVYIIFPYKSKGKMKAESSVRYYDVLAPRLFDRFLPSRRPTKNI
jgi:hypothetical protein